MDEVVEDVDAGERLAQRLAVVKAALDHLDLVEPRHAGDLGRGPDQDPDLVPGLQQPRD
jgi:hypothetical protein